MSFSPTIRCDTVPWQGAARRCWVLGRHGEEMVCFIAAGRVAKRGAHPALRRLVGLSEAAFRSYARERGWRLRITEAP